MVNDRSCRGLVEDVTDIGWEGLEYCMVREGELGFILVLVNGQ
jgi:hypothetical protein